MNRPIVTVAQGKLQGIFQENILGSRYLSFKGIPFASPPVGVLRFKVTFLSSSNNLGFIFILSLSLCKNISIFLFVYQERNNKSSDYNYFVTLYLYIVM